METNQNNIVESTLDESVSDTFMRDIRIIMAKMKIVFFGNLSNPEIQKHIDDWDLWGPLLICIILSLACTTSYKGRTEDSLVFSTVVLIQWVGAVLLALNAKLLKINMFYFVYSVIYSSYFQMMCAFGYSLTPTVFSLILGYFLNPVAFIFKIAGVAWSIRTMNVFLSKCLTNDRRILVLVPAGLFFAFFTICF